MSASGDSIEPRPASALSLNGKVAVSVRPAQPAWMFMQKKGCAGSQATSSARAQVEVALKPRTRTSRSMPQWYCGRGAALGALLRAALGLAPRQRAQQHDLLAIGAGAAAELADQ